MLYIDNINNQITIGSPNGSPIISNTINGIKVSTPIGSPPVVEGSNGVAIGDGATTGSVSNCIAIGYQANASYQTGAIAIGATSTAGGQDSLAAGYGASTGSPYRWAVAVGYNASANGLAGVAIGSGSSVTGSPYAHAIGYNSSATAPYSMALGSEALADRYGEIVFGGANFGSPGDLKVGIATFALSTTSATANQPMNLSGATSGSPGYTLNDKEHMIFFFKGNGVRWDGSTVLNSFVYGYGYAYREDGDSTLTVSCTPVTIGGTNYFNFYADTAQNSIKIRVSPPSGAQWRWAATLDYVLIRRA